MAEVSPRLPKAQAVGLAESRGLPVEHITRLRSQARAAGGGTHAAPALLMARMATKCQADLSKQT